jgi:hypothetical protein
LTCGRYGIEIPGIARHGPKALGAGPLGRACPRAGRGDEIMHSSRKTPTLILAASSLSLCLLVACSRGGAAREPRYRIVKSDPAPLPTHGVPPDKEIEVQLVLQQREVTTRKCYQDVLNQKQDKSFQGTVKLLISLEPSGRATEVRSMGGTLGDREVEECLISAIKTFEFPVLTQAGEVQYEFSFRPAY